MADGRVLRGAIAGGLTVMALLCGGRVDAQQPGANPIRGMFTWEPVGLGGGGAMFTPAISPVDPNLMMLNCDMSGAYISRDGGRAWEMVHHRQLQGNTVCRPAFHPVERDTIYAAHGWGGELRVSRDGGRTFRAIGNLRGRLWGEIAIDPDWPRRMIVGGGGAVASISEDGGESWRACTGLEGRALAFHFDRTSPVDRRVIFAATESGVFRSDDSGVTWVRKTRGLVGRKVNAFAGASNVASGKVVLYCAVPAVAEGGRYVGGVFRSRDRGETWQSVMRGGINAQIKRSDQWADGDVAQYKSLLAADAAPETVYAFNTSTGFDPPNHNAVWKSKDAGESWKATFYSDPRWKGSYNVEPNWRTSNLNQNYQDVGVGWAISAGNPDVVIFTDSMMCYVTHDGGTRWFNGISRAVEAGKAGHESRWHTQGLVVTTTWNYYVDPFDAARHFIAYTDIGFALSTDSGRSWNWWGKDRWAPWQNTCYELAFDPETPGKMWGAFSNVHDIPNGNIIEGRHRASGAGGVCVSEDAGVTWKPSNGGLPASAVTSVVVDRDSPRDARRLCAAVWEHGVYVSEDGGARWAPKGVGLGSAENKRVCRIILHEDGTLFALVTARKVRNEFRGDGVGLYRLGRGETEWVRVNERQFLWPKDFSVDPSDSRVIYTGCADARASKEGGLYRSVDGGQNWKLLLRRGPEHFGAYLDPHRKGWIYATLTEGAPEYGLYLSRDNGNTFDPVEELPFANIQRVAFDPGDDKVIYVTTFGGSVFRGVRSF